MNLHQRLVLLTGASLSALGLAASAQAATTPGVERRISGANVNDTLTISAIGDDETLGVTTEGTSTAFATVGSSDSGEIVLVGSATGTPQQSGHLQLDIANAGDVVVQALAHADNSAGAAKASSYIPIAVDEFGLARGGASISLDNSGALGAKADAKATGTAASASANILFGVFQSAIQATGTAGAASVALNNNGSISFSASAVADGNLLAIATANVRTGIHQHASVAAGTAAIEVTNAGTIAVTAAADAVASSTYTGHAAAFASVRGLQQTALAVRTSFTTAGSGAHEGFDFQPDGPASVSFENSGTLSFAAHGAAKAGSQAIVFADDLGIFQKAVGSDAAASIDNKGQIDGFASAVVTGGRFAAAVASAQGMIQLASAERSLSSASASTSALHFRHFKGGSGAANVSLTNSGTISMVANAHALDTEAVNVGSGSASAIAEAAAGGIGQYVLGSKANATLVNDGSIAMKAVATATGPQNAFVRINASGFGQNASAVATSTSLNFRSNGLTGQIQQFFTGDAVLQFSNSGIFEVEGAGSGNAGADAVVVVDELGGEQSARAGIANLTFNNSGSFSVEGIANASGGAEAEHVAASGAVQFAQGASSALLSIVNSGKVAVGAVAHGAARTGLASNVALVGGLEQEPLSLGTATASVVNSGMVSVGADAKAVSGGGTAFAGALARGIDQNPSFGTLKAVLDNRGQLVVTANASAIGDGSAFALASARAYLVDAANVIADVTNSGSLIAQAVANGSGLAGSALASAAGISVHATNHSSVTANAGALGGSIVNAGKISVLAKVDSAHSGTVGATASGVLISATRNNLVLTNSGTIDVQAVAGHGGPASASGVRVITATAPSLPPRARDLFTFTNDGGTIMARQSTDGGKTWQRGMAIDVTEASNPSDINLFGNGTVLGNIGVQVGDQINVQSGATYFDGIVNPSYLPAGGISAAALDSGLAGVGTLSIRSGGNLVLADPRLTAQVAMYNGPSYALVDTLNVAADGTLTLELQPAASGAQGAGSYSQIFARTANLNGTLVANVTPPNGLFDDSYNWDNVIDAMALGGTFKQCALGGPNAGSVLLNFACSYDANHNVDLSLTRVAFNAVAGLNGNGSAVGRGLERIYSSNLTGSVARMFGDLFLMSQSSHYDLALNQLAGSIYANYLNSLPSLGVRANNLTDEATNCELTLFAPSALDCRSGRVHLWGQIDYQTRNAHADAEAGASMSKRSTRLLGIDADVGASAIVGADAGSITDDVRDSQFGDTVKANGWTVGAYAVYDPGAFFLKGLASYSSFTSHSTRHVDFAGLAPGASFVANPMGRPDATIWSFSLHGGGRLPVGASSVARPYLNLDYVDAKLGGFSEANGGVAGLAVAKSKSSHAFLTAGVKWAAQLRGVVPEIDFGYRYRLGSQQSSVNAFLDGQAAGDFNIASSAQRRGALVAGLNVDGHLGPVEVKIGYEGEFNGSVTSHSANFKFALPLGGHSAAPRAAVAEAPPHPAAVTNMPAPLHAAPPAVSAAPAGAGL